MNKWKQEVKQTQVCVTSFMDDPSNYRNSNLCFHGLIFQKSLICVGTDHGADNLTENEAILKRGGYFHCGGTIIIFFSKIGF